MGSSDDSGDDEDDAVDFQAQVSAMLAPMLKKQKKCQRKLDQLEVLIEQLKAVGSEQLPGLRRELTSTTIEMGGRVERVQSDLAQCASKTEVAVVRQEQTSAEAQLRGSLEEMRGKNAAQELVIQGLASRVEAMERAMRASELKLGSELTSASAQVSQLSAATERQRGEVEARLAELTARAGAQHDALLTKLSQEEADRRNQVASLATKAELAEARTAGDAAANEQGTLLQTLQAQWKMTQDALDAVQGTVPRLATLDALERLDARCGSLQSEMKSLVAKQSASGEAERATYDNGGFGNPASMPGTMLEPARALLTHHSDGGGGAGAPSLRPAQETQQGLRMRTRVGDASAEPMGWA